MTKACKTLTNYKQVTNIKREIYSIQLIKVTRPCYYNNKLVHIRSNWYYSFYMMHNFKF